jgi:hypothetical protein
MLLGCALLLGVTPLFAQVEEGTLLGTVTDSSGATISGATVTLVNQGTDASLTFTTSTDGLYKFTPLKIGTYKITVSAPGFETEVQTDIRVDVSSNVLINITLKPGQTTQTIEVTATQPVLETQSGSVGQVVDERSVNDLPLNGRNFTFLAQLAAGVNTPQQDTRGNAQSGAFAANGNRPSQNNYLLDGIDNNSDTVDFLNGTNYIVLPPVDAIQEFKVQTSDFSAEFGRSGAAVLNATIKSGTNEFHGALWEFLRNDKLDAADYFENADGIPKGEYRQNQFGLTGGFPLIIPHVFDGRNKVFLFGDYEGLRKVQGTVFTGSVPTLAERASGYTNFQDLINSNGVGTCTPTPSAGARCDDLGRDIADGVVLDPATTRLVTAGSVDPVTGLVATTTGYVRDPFSNGTCTSATSFTLANTASCGLNIIPAGRLDPNAIKLLNLYPNPTNSSIFSNFGDSPKGTEFRNAFDTRMDINFNQSNNLFFRFSYVDDPQLIPGIFGGIPDGGGFQDGNQTADAQQSALGYTHTFSPTLINEVRLGFNYLHTTRSGPESGNLTDIPGEFGIQGVPQTSLNGGLPAFGINGLQTLGSNAFLPSNEVSSTFQLTDDVTKIYGKHTFKMGFEWQHVKFSTLQPPWSRGEYDYNGDYTDVVGANAGNTGRVDFLLTPTTSTVGGPDYVGGSSEVYLSNTALTDNGKNYYGTYINDDWKVTSKLTLNLGLRYDFFGLVFEHHGDQANFLPYAAGPYSGPTYLLPASTPCSDLSTSILAQFTTDGIACVSTNANGGGLGNSQKANFSPRVGFAYQVTPKLVVRGGYGLFYNGFENRGYSPNIGENYPFQFSFSYGEPNPYTPISADTPFAGCATAGPGGTATFETGFSCQPLIPSEVGPGGLALRGIQFNYKTPYSMSGNLTVQYQLAPSLSFQAAYASSQSRHLEVFPGSNNVTQLLPYGTNTTEAFPNNLTPFATFGTGASYAATEGDSGYNALQTRIEKQYKYGLNFLATYTWSKTMTDAFDLLNNGSLGGYRGPDIPGVGIQHDFGLAPFDIRNVFHLSGGYELPFGKGKHFLGDATGWEDKLVGGWSVQFIATLQDGQPITLSCPTNPAAGAGCYDIRVKGQPLDLGIHTDGNGVVSWFGNPKAWTQPCELGPGLVPIPDSPSGCVPLTGAAALGGGGTQIPGPGFHRLDFSTFKEIPLSERFRLQFRAEIFNIFNHPNFTAPGFGGNGVVSISGSTNYTSANFGEIGSTRDDPNDAREIQFALKLYY